MTSGTIVWPLKVEKLNISLHALYKALKMPTNKNVIDMLFIH